MKNLVEYIRYVRKLFNEKGSNSLKTIVIGNSSGDMDSVISTIGYSYFSYLKDKGNKDIFPIISFLREDLKLRKDIEFTLKKVGIHEEDLIYVNELKDQERVSIVLVDHNEIDNEEIKELVESRHSKVVAVVDHHVDLGKYPDAAPRVVRKCGSCSSLVLAHFEREVRAAYAGTGTDTDTGTGTPAAVEFWVTAVGVDTAKMSSRWQQQRRTDVCAVMTSYSDSNSDSAGFHREIALAGLSGSALTCLKQQLGLAPIDAGTAPPALALFKQNRTDLSRKAVLPLLVEVVENDTP
ncbi:Exopolyphosphatase [Pichia californica]|uniref:Exopolyphosphatase n=1 Tax=Pichia californica TaxID=460514 RepID=A0A9P6WIG1_9ASCO|nr:Exopolyphosphatase [[Candida] californica]